MYAYIRRKRQGTEAGGVTRKSRSFRLFSDGQSGGINVREIIEKKETSKKSFTISQGATGNKMPLQRVWRNNCGIE